MKHTKMTHNAEAADEKVFLGFWIYLMTDLLMFAVLFAVYAVLRNNTAGGITIAEIFNGPFVLTETMILLTGSFICGLAHLIAEKGNKRKTLVLLAATAVLGIIFLGMELYEFHHLISEGHSFTQSAFLSAYFSLVGFHGLHIVAGTIWILVLMAYVFRNGLTPGNIRKTKLVGIFWHFLDIVWIFIFTIVYLFGGVL